MLYKLSCQHCSGRVSFEDEAVGTTVECPHCHEPLALIAPTSSQVAPQTSGPRRRRRWVLVSLGGLGIVLAAGLAVGCVYVFQEREVPVSEAGLVVANTNELTVDAPEGEIQKVRIKRGWNYEVTLHKDFPLATVWYCDVSFKAKPTPAKADATVRESLEKCIKHGPSQEIVAIAFMGNRPLAKTEYSGPLVWNPEEKAIQRWGETTAGKAWPGQAQ